MCVRWDRRGKSSTPIPPPCMRVKVGLHETFSLADWLIERTMGAMAHNLRFANQKSKLKKPMDAPLRFHPFLRPMVWGGRRLGEILGKSLPTREDYGESWEISDHALHQSIVASGPRAGQSLRHLMERERADLLGAAAATQALF